jgi:hypothetical protein
MVMVLPTVLKIVARDVTFSGEHGLKNLSVSSVFDKMIGEFIF